MNILSKSAASLALFAAMSASAFAQDTATTAPVTETAPATEAQSTPPKDAAEILSMGTEVTDPNEVGTSYTLSTHGDWELRCIKAAEGQDPCNLYQRPMAIRLLKSLCSSCPMAAKPKPARRSSPRLKHCSPSK
jgi:invasion protein IalB